MNIIYKDITTSEVKAVFINCTTLSPLWNDETKYIKEETEDTPPTLPLIRADFETLDNRIRRLIKEVKA